MAGLPANPMDSEVWKARHLAPISLKNENMVWNMIKFECSEAMAKYPTTIQEDIELLKGDTLTSQQRMCVSLRHDEKEVLQFMLNANDKIEALVKMSSKEARKEISRDQGKDYAGMLNYVNKTIIPLIEKTEK